MSGPPLFIIHVLQCVTLVMMHNLATSVESSYYG